MRGPTEPKETPDRILVFDTETRTDSAQALTFGSYALYTYSEFDHRGLFYDPDELSNSERSILEVFAKENDLLFWTVREFCEELLYNELVELGTLCIGFNRPFDLSRRPSRLYLPEKDETPFPLSCSTNREMCACESLI